MLNYIISFLRYWLPKEPHICPCRWEPTFTPVVPVLCYPNVDQELLRECKEVIHKIEQDHGPQNGDYKRHLALNALAGLRNLNKSNRKLNFHLELAFQLVGLK